MGLKSMTGFGRISRPYKDKKIIVEIKSLNSKGFDFFCRIASAYRDKEIDIRNIVSKKLERGKIEMSIYTEENTESQKKAINHTLAIAYHKELKQLSEILNEADTSLLPLVLKMPDVMKNEKEELDEEEGEFILNVINDAVIELDKFRITEGTTLQKEIEERINLIGNLLAKIEELDSTRVDAIKNRIKTNLNETIGFDKIDQNRLEQELIFYIEKLDITEEKTRLKTHCDFFLQNMLEDSTGRKLSFISQEIGREINTIGSKANNAPIQMIVVQMKDELEKIKEQLNNIL